MKNGDAPKVRANSLAPICRSSNCHDSECSRYARRKMLFLNVVLVVSKFQCAWVKNADAPDKVGEDTPLRKQL